METVFTDVLIIGNGLTGVRAAAEASARGSSVTVLCKGPCASVEIMGFDAPVRPDDSADLFYHDIMESGRWINNPKLAALMAKNSVKEAESIEKIGLSFSKNEDGSYKTARPLGSSVPRLISVQSFTGKIALDAYRDIAVKNGCTFLSPVVGLRLIREEDRVIGAIALRTDTGSFVCCYASAVVIATGGCGKIFPQTTYPSGIDGDGYAMAYRAGAELVDMEFMQFEPCCFIKPDGIRGAVAVTTMLLEGGQLRNGSGEEFIPGGYQMQKSRLAFYIDKEIREGRASPSGGVYYDVTALPWERVAVDHAVFYLPAKRGGLDITRETAEVMPMAHTCVGGIRINERCETTVTGLFAAGEAAGGVHGANRIGGCSGTETLVFGQNAGYWAGEFAKSHPIRRDGIRPEDVAFGVSSERADRLEVLRGRTGQAVADGLGIVRNRKKLEDLLDILGETAEEASSIQPDTPKTLREKNRLENQLLVAEMQARASLMRKESRGVFYREDYPDEREEYSGNISLRGNGQKMDLSFSGRVWEEE